MVTIDNVTITPNPVNAGQTFLISVAVTDDTPWLKDRIGRYLKDRLGKVLKVKEAE